MSLAPILTPIPRRLALPGPLDWSAARAHLAALDTTAEAFIFAAFAEAPGLEAKPRHFFGCLDAVAARIARAQAQGFGIFVAVNAMTGHRRRLAEVARIRAVWAERDRPGKPLPLAASLVIATSPGKSHEYLWIDTTSPLDPAEARRINRRIAAAYDADPQATDAARVLRLAGTWNLKREPFAVRILAAPGHRYAAETLSAAFPEPPPPILPPRPSLALPLSADRSARYLAAVIRGVTDDLAAAKPGTRNASLNKAAFRLGQLGLDADAITALLTPIALAIGLTATETAATIQSGAEAGLAANRPAKA